MKANVMSGLFSLHSTNIVRFAKPYSLGGDGSLSTLCFSGANVACMGMALITGNHIDSLLSETGLSGHSLPFLWSLGTEFSTLLVIVNCLLCLHEFFYGPLPPFRYSTVSASATFQTLLTHGVHQDLGQARHHHVWVKRSLAWATCLLLLGPRWLGMFWRMLLLK